jgi:hypothetical protein
VGRRASSRSQSSSNMILAGSFRVVVGAVVFDLEQAIQALLQCIEGLELHGLLVNIGCGAEPER